MIVGFTGTSKYVPLTQHRLLSDLVLRMDPNKIMEAHHGDCVGADRIFDSICADFAIPRHAHPGTNANGESPRRAYCKAEVVNDPLPYLVRNQVIVTLSQLLIACPDGPERLRSGTWSTVRSARQAGVPVILVWPDGKVDS